MSWEQTACQLKDCRKSSEPRSYRDLCMPLQHGGDFQVNTTEIESTFFFKELLSWTIIVKELANSLNSSIHFNHCFIFTHYAIILLVLVCVAILLYNLSPTHWYKSISATSLFMHRSSLIIVAIIVISITKDTLLHVICHVHHDSFSQTFCTMQTFVFRHISSLLIQILTSSVAF